MSGSRRYRSIGSRALVVAAVSATVLSLGAVLAGSAGAAAQSPGHSPVPVFSAAYGVSCPTASACMAVGGYNSDGVVLVLTERWDGSGWSVLPSAAPSGATSSQLNAVSCADAMNCVAVGSYSDSNFLNWPFAESWDGSSWAVVSVPTPTGGSFAGLSGVSCTGASSCVAVGSFTNRRSRTVPLTEFWNGTAWSVHGSPHPAGATSSGLAAVSCASASACMAAGSYVNAASLGVPFTEWWNGSAWSVVASPSPAGAQGGYLAGVSCPTASSCEAVGSYFDSSFTAVTLAESWDGTSWTLVASPTPTDSPSSALSAVSCASASNCLAVGHSYSPSFAGKDDTLAESWNGTSWTAVASPSPSTSSGLSGVSCAAVASCMAVGSFFNSANDYQTLAESWSGAAMKIVNQDADLSGVSCADALHCLAVGSAISPDSVSVTFAEVRQGKHWRAVRPADPADSEGSYLSAVDCTSADHCVAVGYYYRVDNTRLTLVEEWDGRRWTIVPSPSLDGVAYSVLYGVSCVSASHCMAVGSAAGFVLAESWNGSAWRIVRTADRSTEAYGELNDVVCSSASSCLAVGYETDTHYHADVTLAERWNGARWTVVPSAAPGKNRVRSSVLHGVSCSAADTCFAVGYRQRPSRNFTTLTERWTGESWVAQASPSPAGSPYSNLNAISCVASGECLAVGNYLDAAGNFVPLGETWTGAAWQLVAGPDPSTTPISYLEDVACPAALTCTAVGASGDSADLNPLVQGWNS
jgi:hypothetical protein